jgi:hypothetical protein
MHLVVPAAYLLPGTSVLGGREWPQWDRRALLVNEKYCLMGVCHRLHVPIVAVIGQVRHIVSGCLQSPTRGQDRASGVKHEAKGRLHRLAKRLAT